MRRYRLLTTLGIGLACAAGCISVKAPERINIGSGRSEPVDSSRVPPTANHEEARRELTKAYQRIQELERENARLREHD